jgi:cytochrome c-type biogenesis protein CcmH
MTAFLITAALLVAGAVLFVVPALVRGRARPAESRDVVNTAVYRDQLRELESDLRSGTLAADQVDKARGEIEARLIDDVSAERLGEHIVPQTPARSRTSAIAFGIAVPLCALAVYLGVGNPRALDPQPGGGTDHGVTQQQLQSLIERLAARMKDNPEDAEGWVMLARSYAVLGRYLESADAYARAAARIPDDAQLLADYADALAMAQGRRLHGEPEKIVARALAADPNNIKALALAGTAAFDRKNYAEAVRHWERIRGLVPPASQFADSLQASIAEARELGGMRPAAGKAQTPAAGPAQTPVAAPARVSGTATLAPALAGKVAPTDTVFIFARAAEGPRIPLAVLRKQARDLPVSFVLDDSMAMSPQMKLSGQTRIVVGARVSKTANATPQAGDIQGLSAPVKVGASGVAVTIDTEVR